MAFLRGKLATTAIGMVPGRGVEPQSRDVISILTVTDRPRLPGMVVHQGVEPYPRVFQARVLPVTPMNHGRSAQNRTEVIWSQTIRLTTIRHSVAVYTRIIMRMMIARTRKIVVKVPFMSRTIPQCASRESNPDQEGVNLLLFH